VPGLLAFVFGYFAFRSRIKGVYFSIITQAMTYAAMLLFFRNETGFGGNNGFTDFKRILGMPWPRRPCAWRCSSDRLRCWASSCWRAGWCAASSAACCRPSAMPRRASCSRLQPAALQAHHLGHLAMMCGVAGALYVPQVGIINPSEMSAANSIEIAIWAAVGGRGTLIGPIIGAFAVNGAKSWLTVVAPEYWLYFLGRCSSS
jgi:urea transport system permease protein